METINSIQWWAVDKIFIDGEPFDINKKLDPVETIRLRRNLYLAKSDILATDSFVELIIGYIYLFRLDKDYICKVTRITEECVKIEDNEEFINNYTLHLTKLFDVEKNDVEITQVDKNLYLMEVNNENL